MPKDLAGKISDSELEVMKLLPGLKGRRPPGKAECLLLLPAHQ